MPKRVMATAPTDLALDQRAQAPLYRQLYERLRAQILSGQLERGARLPSTRTLASELGVSRNTTALAYEMLSLEGYIESRVGDGARVARTQPEQTFQAPRRRPQRPAQAPTPSLSRRGQALLGARYPGELYGPERVGDGGPFRAGEPDLAAFPLETWARLLARHTRRAASAILPYQSAQGYTPLREAIAAHIGITRGVHCSPEQVLITAGSQGALDLAARTLLDPGDAAWVEDPGYLGARGALLAAGARLIPVPVDAQGLDVDAGRASGSDARLAVVTPSHQFPTAVTMSLSRRLALLAWAHEARAWIVEDDYDSEYRYGGRPLEALHGLDGAGHVVYIGTFSKVLSPSLRLGYLVAPRDAIAGFIAARRFIDVHMPLLEQMALADFIGEGHYDRHLRRMRLIYLHRRDALVAALRDELGAQLEVTPPEAGLHLAAWLAPGLSARAVAWRAAEHGVSALPIIPQRASDDEGDDQREGLLLGFSLASPERLRAGVRVLARALRETASGDPQTAR